MFHGTAVAIARGEIHVWIDPGRVLRQRFLNHTVPGHEIPPVLDGEKAEAADAVSNRYLIGGLSLTIRQHHLFKQEVLFGKPMFQPARHQAHGGRMPLQRASEFCQKGFRQRGLRACQIGQRQDQIVGFCLGHVQHSVRPLRSEISVLAGVHDADCHPAQILDECQPEHQRHCPEFADRQRGHRLVGVDERIEHRHVHTSVSVGNHFQSDAIRSRTVAGRTRGQRWKPAQVGSR